MRKLKVLLSVVAMSFVMVGCGSSGGSSSDSPDIPDVDNSTLAVGTNSVGYYGPDVILGSHTIRGSWSLTNKSTGAILSFTFDDSSIIEWIKDGWTSYWKYGVTKDGREMMFDEMRITIYFATSDTCYDSYLDNVYTGEGQNTTLCKK